MAWDASGRELGRTTLSVKGCPDYAAWTEGDTLHLVPGESQVRRWVKTLL